MIQVSIKTKKSKLIPSLLKRKSMCEVEATQVHTYRLKRESGDAVVIASQDKNILDIYGRAADRKVWIKRNDFTDPEMTQSAIITVIKELEKFEPNECSAIAEGIKEAFNEKYGPTWHCLVIVRGGFSVQNEDNHYICLDIDDYLIVLFKQ